jgi:hypothetical protein
MRLLIIIGLAGVVMVGLLCSKWDNVGREELSDRWATEYHGARGVDGRGWTNLVRKFGSEYRVVGDDIYGARFVGDDCVIYGDNGLFGVCGDRPPIFVGLLPGNSFPAGATSFNGQGDQVYTIDAIKEAARSVEEERVGGRWIAQREAFPWAYYGPEPKVILFRDDSLRGRFPLSSMPVLAYRYLEDDCLMFVHPGTGRGFSYYTAVKCGRREEVHVGAVEKPADIQAPTEILVEPPRSNTPVRMTIDQIKSEGLAATLR